MRIIFIHCSHTDMKITQKEGKKRIRIQSVFIFLWHLRESYRMQKTDFNKLTWSNPSEKINAGKLISLLLWILCIINLFYKKSVFRVYASVQVPPPPLPQYPNIIKSKISFIDRYILMPPPLIWRNGQERKQISYGNWRDNLTVFIH